MKKLMLPLFAATLLIAGTSCNKSYTCECNNTYSIAGNTIYTTTTSETFRTNKNDARDRCATTVNSYAISGSLVGLDTIITGQEERLCNLR